MESAPHVESRHSCLLTFLSAPSHWRVTGTATRAYLFPTALCILVPVLVPAQKANLMIQRLSCAFALALLFTLPAAAATFTVTNTNDSGAASLRQAILDANAAAGIDTIAFSIGSGPQLIALNTLLPPVTDTAIIDGRTQPGYSGTPLIGLDGSLFTSVSYQHHPSGIELQANGSSVYALSITGFHSSDYTSFQGSSGITVEGTGCVVRKCWLGIARDGKTIGRNDHNLELVGTGNFIGGPGEGNVMSGGYVGISDVDLSFPRTASNVIQNNIIGLDPTGLSRKDNVYGIQIMVNGDTIQNNTIAGNTFGDVHLSGGNFVFRGNKVGINAAGTVIPNSYSWEILVISGYPNTASGIIGGPNPGDGNEIGGAFSAIHIQNSGPTTVQGNTIHDSGIGIELDPASGIKIWDNTIRNGSTGVWVRAGGGNSILRNSIYGNYSAGIQLATTYPLLNDSGDPDAGGNLGQNYPVITSASLINNTTSITGTLNSTPNQTYHLEFFSNPQCDASGYGEGRTYLGTTDATTNGSGDASFTVTFNTALTPGSIVTATATDSSSNTSEFSKCAVVQGPGTISFSNPSISFSETAGTATLSVVRTTGALGAVSVNYTTASGTASAGADFTTTSGTLTFANGQTSATINVPIIDDHVYEGAPQEQFTVMLSNPAGGAALGNPSVATVTISDDEAPPIVTIADAHVTEGNSGTTNMPFTVTLSEPIGVPATVSYSATGSGAQAGVDFVATSGQLTFSPGETQKVINVPVIGDTSYEFDEYVDVALSSPTNSTLSPPKDRARGTIVNDDAGPSLTIDDISVTEGNSGDTHAVFTVTLSGSTLSGWLDVGVQLQSGSAQLGSDFDGALTSFRFLQGETKKTVSVTIHGDTLIEADEKFTATITSAVSGTETATLTKPTGTCTILNDDLGMTSLKLARGTTGRMTIYLGNPLPASGSITVTSSQPQIAEVPSTVATEGGRSTIGFDVHALSTGTSLITAKLPPSLGGTTLVGSVEVTEASGVFVTQVTPPNGAATGGTQTTISGLNFAPPCSVTFDSNAAADVSFVSATSLRATTPPHAAGSVDVGVTCGTDHYTFANGFLYTANAPHLSSVSPASGATRGGTLVVLSGAGLSSSCGARFGDADAKIVNDLSPDKLVVNTPEHDAGFVDVKLECGDASTTLPAAFTYMPVADAAAVIGDVNPLTAAPGESVTVTGVGFRTSDAIAFGNLRANIINTIPASHVAVIPNIPAGKVAVTLTDADGHVSTTGPIFTVLDPVSPKITSVSPSRVAPGGEIVITGEGFRAPYIFALDDKSAGTIVDLSFSRAVVRIDPSRAAGSYTLGVLNAAGNLAAVGPKIDVGSALEASSIGPICATSNGGADVTVKGGGFQQGVRVSFGSAAATNVRVIDDHTLMVTVPEGRIGWPVVTITNPNGDTTTVTRGFFYYSPYDKDGGCATTRTRSVRH
jgi:parallel beta-helix repeat protein